MVKHALILKVKRLVQPLKQDLFYWKLEIIVIMVLQIVMSNKTESSFYLQRDLTT